MSRKEEIGTNSYTWKLNDFDSILNYMNNIYNNYGKNKTTKGKYFVVLYGPPGSGKTMARKFAIQLIKEIYKEKNINNTFIDTNIDSLTNDRIVNKNGDTVLDLLIKNSKKYKSITKLSETSQKIYRKYRNDNISEILINMALYLGKNIFFETSSPSIEYIKNITYISSYYGYIPIIIYPYINDPKILYDRTILRGYKEGRFLNCSGKYQIREKIFECAKNFHLFKKFDNEDIVILRYNGNIKISESKLTKENIEYMYIRKKNIEFGKIKLNTKLIKDC